MEREEKGIKKWIVVLSLATAPVWAAGKARKRIITKAQAAEELGLSVRQVKRLVAELKKRGDRAVLHGLRGRPSNNRIEAAQRDQALIILGGEEYRGCGPTLAAESLAEQHGILVSRETVRRWMQEGGLWKPHARPMERILQWRPRPVAAAAEPVWRVGAMGHQRARLAGRAWAATVLDRDN